MGMRRNILLQLTRYSLEENLLGLISFHVDFADNQLIFLHLPSVQYTWVEEPKLAYYLQQEQASVSSTAEARVQKSMRSKFKHKRTG